jgi:hypothetical protein
VASWRGDTTDDSARECPAGQGQTNYAEDITSFESQIRVALLVDYPVLMRAVRAVESEAVPRLGDIVGAARELGGVFISRAYGAWYDIDEATTAFTEGLDPVFVPPLGPGNVPTTSALIADGLSILKQGRVDVLALSGDDRLLPLLTAAQDEDLPIALIAHACQPDGPCLPLASSASPASDFVRTITRAERYRRSRSAA